MTTRVVNLHREPYHVYIGRAGRGQDGYFGNPFTLAEHGPAALKRFEEHFHNRIVTDPEYRACVLALRGKVLGCFCKPGPCHGDVIADYLDDPCEGCDGTGMYEREKDSAPMFCGCATGEAALLADEFHGPWTRAAMAKYVAGSRWKPTPPRCVHRDRGGKRCRKPAVSRDRCERHTLALIRLAREFMQRTTGGE